METIGLLSGIGHLPVDVALSAKSMGYRVIAVGVVPDIDPELAEAVDAYYDIHIGKIGKIISTLKKNDVKTVTMIGKVTKELLYKAGAVVPDLRAIKILACPSGRLVRTLCFHEPRSRVMRAAGVQAVSVQPSALGKSSKSDS